ncbi:reverse transcriptase domain-containing protein [Tanacetum coccineum]
MAGVDVDTLTMEQYLAFSQENQEPSVVKPKIGGNVNFEIKSQFMRELREDTFSGNKDEDAYDHIYRVLSIVGLFKIPGVSKDAVMLLGPIPRMRPAQALTAIQTMADHSQKWHDRTTSSNIKSSSNNDKLDALVNKNNGGKFRVGPPRYYTKVDNLPPYGERRKSLKELLAKHQEESARRSTEMEVWIKKLQENAEINTRNQSASLKNLETQIEQLTKEIHSDKTHSSSPKHIKTVTADHETSGPNKLHGVSFISEPESDTPEILQHQLPPKELNPGSFTLPYKIGKFNFYAMAELGASINVMPRSIFEHLHLTNLKKTNMLCEMADMSKKEPSGIVENVLVKIDKFIFPSDFVIIDNTPSQTIILGRPFFATIHAEIDVFAGKISLRINKDRISNWDNRSPNLDDQEAKKQKINLDENVPRAHFCNPIKQNIKEQTKIWPSCDPDKKMCDGGVEICGVSKNGNLRFWYCNYDNERRNIKGKGLSFPDFLLAKYGKSQTNALVWDNRYAEWCDISPSSEASSQESNNSRPRDYTFREWTLIKVGHTDISELVKKALLKLWCFDDYKWEFNLEIDKLADEYKLGIGKKRHILDNIWEYCNQVHNKNYEWHNYEFVNEECEEIGIEDKDYHPPEVQVETFEVKKYSFKGRQSFICVTKDVDNILPLGRKNGSKFKEMIRKKVENNKT